MTIPVLILFKVALFSLLLYIGWRPIGKHIRQYCQRMKLALSEGTPMDPTDDMFPQEFSKYALLMLSVVFIVMSPFLMPATQEPERLVKVRWVTPPPVYLQYPAPQPFELRTPGQELFDAVFDPTR